MSQSKTTETETENKASHTPATPPNTPNKASTLDIGNVTTTPPPIPLSQKTQNLVKMLDTLEEEDVMSSSERMERADRTPIPRGTNIPPAGMEVESDEDEDDNYEN